MSQSIKTNFLRSNLLVLLIFFVSCFGFAQNGINYKALIKNGSGNVVANQLITIQFSILQGIAQTNVYTETHTPTTDTNGIIIVNIGEGVVQSGSFNTISWEGDNTFLNVQVDTGAGLVDLGTTQFKAVPYALVSADNKWTLTGNDISNNNIGKVGIGTSTPAYPLDVLHSGSTGIRIKSSNSFCVLDIDASSGDAALRFQKAGVNMWNIRNNPATDDLQFFEAPGGERMQIQNNTGNIGINDNTPTEKLSIGGKIKIVDSTQGAGKILTSDANGVGTWQNININSSFTTSNTFLGRSSLINNTIGHDNTAYGDGSLYSNTTGYINTAIGDSSLYFNTSGIANVAVGAVSLRSNTTGNDNVAVGYSSLYSNTTGINNVATGNSALSSNTTGNNNTANGHLSLSKNTTGINNVAVGYSSLYSNTTGNNNVATGNGSLYRNTTGINNTANGDLSLSTNTTGVNNTATGYQSLQLNTTGSSNTAIGYLSLPVNNAGWDNTAVGYNSLAANTTGNYNTAVGKGALMNVTTGLNNTGIGDTAQVPNAAGDNQVRIGNTFVIYAGIQVPWTITSDKRWKSDIKPSNLGLDFINKLNPVSYYRNNDKNKKIEYGFIAQELEETLHNAGATNNGIITKDDDGMYSVRYNDLMAPMVKATQEIDSKVTSLENQNKQLQQIIELLTKRIETLEKK